MKTYTALHAFDIKTTINNNYNNYTSIYNLLYCIYSSVVLVQQIILVLALVLVLSADITEVLIIVDSDDVI